MMRGMVQLMPLVSVSEMNERLIGMVHEKGAKFATKVIVMELPQKTLAESEAREDDSGD